MAIKWRNFSFRSTTAGSGSWNAGGINAGTDLDPNDATNTTTVLTAGAAPYETMSSDGLHACGLFGAAGSLDSSKTNAGGNTLLGGCFNITSSGVCFQIDADPGVYDLRMALGVTNNSGSRERVAIFEGTRDQLYADLGANLNVVKLFAASTSLNAGDWVISKTDGSTWKVTSPTTGSATCGATDPSGGSVGGTFVSGSVTFTKQARVALLVADATTGAASTVIDTASAIGSTGSIAGASWGANTVTVTLTPTYGNAFAILKTASGALNVRQLGIRSHTPVLVDVTLKDDFKVSQGSTPTVYCNQPAGYAALKIITTDGAYNAAAFSLSGTLASYFTPTKIGADIWLVHNSTLLPDSLAGSQSLDIIQTDANASPTTHTTSFTATVVSSQGRPTNTTWQGRITTQNWLNRKKVADIHATTLWAGYQSQSFVTDDLVSDASTFQIAFNRAVTNATGTSWHRIRMGGNGDYIGALTLVGNFGDGGLLVEPEAGDDPGYLMRCSNTLVHGWHMRNLRIPINYAKVGFSTGRTTSWLFRGGDPKNGATGIAGSGKYLRFKASGCRMGFMYDAGSMVSDYSTKASGFCYFNHGESVELSDNLVNGSGAPMFMCAGIRALRISGNDFQTMAHDTLRFNNADTWDSTVVAFSDANVHVWISGNTLRNEIDYNGYSNANHPDYIQTIGFAQDMARRVSNATQDGKVNTYWKPGQKGLCVYSSPPAIYTVATAGASTLTAAASIGATTVTVNSTAGMPTNLPQSMDFYDPTNGDAPYQRVTLTAVAGTTLTFTPSLTVALPVGAKTATSIVGDDAASPAGQGSGIQDGGVTWNWFQDYNTASTVYLVQEEDTLHSACPDGDQIASPHDRQWMLDSNGQRNCPIIASINNNLYGSISDYGPTFADGTMHAEFNTNIGPYRIFPSIAAGSAYIHALQTGSIRAFNNMMQRATMVNTGALAKANEVLVDFHAAAVSPNRPGDLLTGTFSNATVDDNLNRWVYPQLDDSGTNSAAAFRTAFRGIAKALTGTAGIDP